MTGLLLAVCSIMSSLFSHILMTSYLVSYFSLPVLLHYFVFHFLSDVKRIFSRFCLRQIWIFNFLRHCSNMPKCKMLFEFCVLSRGSGEFGCQYQSSQLLGKTVLWNNLLYVDCDVKFCSLIQSLVNSRIKRIAPIGSVLYLHVTR